MRRLGLASIEDCMKIGKTSMAGDGEELELSLGFIGFGSPRKPWSSGMMEGHKIMELSMGHDECIVL